MKNIINNIFNSKKMAGQIFCKNCSKQIHPNEGCYNTPMGIYCISCYDKKIKEAKIIIKKTNKK